MSISPLTNQAATTTGFRDSWRNTMRITTVRIIVQAVTFVMFLAFVLLTTYANLDRLPGLRLWVSKFLEIDPLVAIAGALTTHTVYKGLLWSLVVLIPTFFLGRFLCNWLCPFGTMHHFVGWLLNRRTPEQRIASNRYRASYAIKYYVLAAMLVAAVFGSLQIGLLDPICLIYRSFTGAILPAANMPTQTVFGDYRLHQGAWLIGFLMLGLIAMNLIIPRFFCRVLCPLGAMLGLLSRFCWWRIDRDPIKCQGCNRCLLTCEGACDPHTSLRTSECLVCLNCIEECPEGALSYALLPSREHEVAAPDISRRKIIFAAVAGALFYPFMRTTGRTTRDFSSKLIRPPGAVEELDFLARCIKCDQCIRVCPTNVLQPGWDEAGFEGLWTPVLNFRIGHCQLHCTACGHVCPTGAIQRISVERKLGLGEFSADGPIRIGTAHFDMGRCLPHSKNIPCVVCEEVCPTSPKAIRGELQLRPVRNGRKLVLSSTANTITLSEWSGPGDSLPRPVRFEPDQWQGDGTSRYFAVIQHSDGLAETHGITSNDTDTLTIEGRFVRPPEPGTTVVLHRELRIPMIDADLCTGCGICEKQCPVVGDRRAVYVTADGETRSQHLPHPDRNRSVRIAAGANLPSGDRPTIGLTEG